MWKAAALLCCSLSVAAARLESKPAGIQSQKQIEKDKIKVKSKAANKHTETPAMRFLALWTGKALT